MGNTAPFKNDNTLLDAITDGYGSKHFPVQRTSFVATDNGKAIGYIMKKNQLPLPSSVSMRNGVWKINGGTSNIVFGAINDEKAQIVYTNGTGSQLLTE